MRGKLEHPAREIRRLRRCINDLVSVLALPAMWSGCDTSHIAHTLLEALLRMGDLDLVYLRLKGRLGDPPIEEVRVAPSRPPMPRAEEMCDVLRARLGDDPTKWPPTVRYSTDDGDISILPLQLGLEGEIGVLAAGSRWARFPEDTETLVLSVAANQAAIALQEARHLSEQRRLASELDRRVTQRTRQLAEANEELKKEIAERRRAEAALRESERSSRLIVDSIPGLVAILTPAGEVDVVNPQLVEYCGRTLEELRQWATNATIHVEDMPHVAEVFAPAIAAGVPYDFEARILRFDGVYRWFQVRGLPLRETDGRIVRWYVLLTDIDQMKRAEEARKRSEALLAHGQRLSATGTFSWRVATDEIVWSDEIYRIFELPQGVRVTFELFGARVHPDDRATLFELIERARGDGNDLEHGYRLLMPAGSVKYVHLVAHGARDQAGHVEYIGAVQDVTERHVSEEALGRVRSDLAHVARVTSLGVLTASIAHEVNQPLSGIITNASTCLRMLAADPPNIDGARETARRTIRDGNRASDVIARLRALFDKKTVMTEPVALNEATREVIALSRSVLRKNRVILRTELADDLPPVIGDRVQLQQVILNLLRNASDAMGGVDDRPRQLVIRTGLDEGDRIRLSVQDSGIGFEPERPDKLFEAFYTTKSDGMGIGLSVSRSIIESHQGRIWAARNEGPGATFSFSIPGIIRARATDAEPSTRNP